MLIAPSDVKNRRANWRGQEGPLDWTRQAGDDVRGEVGEAGLTATEISKEMA